MTGKEGALSLQLSCFVRFLFFQSGFEGERFIICADNNFKPLKGVSFKPDGYTQCTADIYCINGFAVLSISFPISCI